MNDETVTDALLREFLLGKVTDDVRERVEGLFVTDPQARERVLAVEQDLIEDYLEGSFSADDSERFVASYTQTAEQRRKLRITQSIKDWAVTEANAGQSVPAVVSSWQRSWLRPAFLVPVAAMVLIAIVVAVFWFSKRARHSEIERELVQLNAPGNTTVASVQRELLPVNVRGTESPAPLHSSPGNGVVEVRLLLLIRDERQPSYTATIHRVGSNESYTIPNLQAASNGRTIHLRLPAQFLIRGDYQITLTPDIGEYQLTVVD
jgi:hypothetical protein